MNWIKKTIKKSMSEMTLLCIAKAKKREEKRIVEFRKKLKIPEYEISQYAEYKMKSKIGKIFVDEKILEEYCVKSYEIDFYFMSIMKKKIRVDKKQRNYLLFRIGVYFSGHNLIVEVDEKGHTGRDLVFVIKRQ